MMLSLLIEDLAPEIHAMIKRTINRIVDNHARAKQEEKIGAILNFAKYNLLPENSISLEDLTGYLIKLLRMSYTNVPWKYMIAK